MLFRILLFASLILAAGSVFGATFSVSKTADTDDGVCNSDCSLREAITAANDNGDGADTINFNIPGGGVKTITVLSSLPYIRSSLTINGTTQSGYFGTPMIEVSGEGANSYGIRINSPASVNDISVTIIALAINRHLYGVNSECFHRCDLTLLGNFIGTDPTGTIDRGNSWYGVRVNPIDGSVITIGGAGALEGNLISGNGLDGANNSFGGIGIIPDSPGTEHRGSVQVNVIGNKIGTTLSGNSDLGNTENGITVTERDATQGFDAIDIALTIGGDTAGERNIISGNDDSGIEIDGTNATITGNFIGLNAAGTAALGNGGDGFFADYGVVLTARSGSNFNIGGDSAGEGNAISGNGGAGIFVSTGAGGTGSSQLSVQGNLIGTNAAGTAAIGNAGSGIRIDTSTNYTVNGTIGGVTALARNVISGNLADGISIGSGNIGVYGNYIGTDKNGAAGIGNAFAGVRVTNAGDAAIGGTLIFNSSPFDAGNLISGNGASGIEIDETATVPSIIRRNRIGTDAVGTNPIPNSAHGISVRSSNNIIGSNTSALDGNQIAGNALNGIRINGAGANKIFANRIGTNGVGGSSLPNGQNGIEIFAGDGNLIGDATNGISANIISGNVGNGISIGGATSSGNRIENNIIGAGSVGNDIGNLLHGVFIQTANSNFIGSAAGTGNTIAFNLTGVRILSGTDNEIRRNAIYSNDELGIDLDSLGITPNDSGDGDGGANRRQNFPTVARATTAGIAGTLNSTPNTNLTVDFYRTDACDTSGSGEGRYFLGSAAAITDGAGNATFNFPTSLALGQVVTATATVTNLVLANDTSEFSPCMTVTPPPTIAFSLAAYSANEGAASRTVIVNRSGALDGTVTVDYSTANGSATAGEDYTATSGTLTFLNGETLKTFDVPMLNDPNDEPDETVNLSLSNPTGGAALATPSASVLTVTDNDGPPTVSVSDVTLAEGNSGTKTFTFQVSLSAASGFPVSVSFATADGSANLTDYTGLSGQVPFAAGESTKNLLIQVNGDTAVEPDETFVLNISNPANATLGDAQGVGTILNDDATTVSHSITGTIRKANGAPLATALVALEGSAESTTQTDVNGGFTFQSLASGGSYSVRPQATPFKCAPASRVYSNLAADVVDADFIAMQRTPFDFDGDGLSDLSIFRPSNGEWWNLLSSGGNAAAQFGVSTDKLAAGDWTGDGLTDIAFWRESIGTWFVLRSDDSSFYSFPFGNAGDVPASADYDGDGLTDAAVFRPSTSTWYVRKSTGGTAITHFGALGDKPVAADYDGDGKADIAIFRPSVGEWWILKSSDGQAFAAQFGTAQDRPIAQDYTGDGKADIAFWRPSNGTWYVLRSDDGSYYSAPFGVGGDIPVTGDYDGDGKSDVAVFRPSTGTWFINRTTSGLFISGFGTSGDLPVSSAQIP